MNIQEAILHLSLIDGVGPGAIKYLLEKSPKDFVLTDLYSLSQFDLKNIFRLSDNIAKKVFEGLQDTKSLNTELDLIDKHKIGWTTFIDDEYPYLLKNTNLPPAVITWKGRPLNDLHKKIAIIGSRKATSYSYNIINNLVASLVENSWSIVSGGAIGADTMAHQATLNVQGKTIAVLGSGLLKPYPALNKQLFQDIIESGGTIISPFPVNFSALPANFPARNRVISGISKGCIVTQASLKSGTRITALYALEQGREVFAVPGPIDDELSFGCNKLIQEGAKLITSAQDILQEFGEEYLNNEIASESFVNETNISIFEKIPETIEEKIVWICRTPSSVDDLTDKIGIGTQELQYKLFDLQLDGKIKQNFVGLWERI